MIKKISTLLCISFLLSSQTVLAVGSAGFENASFSAESAAQGNAVVAQANEPAAISYNPAGLVQLEGIQAQYNSAFIDVFTRHTHNNNINYSSGTLSYVPTGYLTIKPNKYFGDRLAFGIGADSPFGLANKYDSNDPHVHYTGWRNYLKMFTIKPVAAIKLTKRLSIGAGPVYYRIYDFGGIQAYPNQLVPLGLSTDGQIRLNLAGNTWGWQGGILTEPVDNHHLGFYVRSPVTVHTRGQVKVENSTSGNFETGANAKIDLPLNLTFAYAFDITPKTTIEADFGYTRWAAHKRLYINADHVNTLPGDLVPTREDAILAALGKTDKDYDDGFSIHIGGNHKFNEKFKLMLGSFFYTAVVPQDHFIPAVPDSNRLGFTAGFNYEICKNLTLGTAYLGEMALRRTVDSGVAESTSLPNSSVDGKYFSYIQGFYLTLTYKWENLFN